jgi:hypothetical protein
MVEIPQAPWFSISMSETPPESHQRMARELTAWVQQVREALVKVAESVQEPRTAAAGVTGPEKGAETGREPLLTPEAARDFGRSILREQNTNPPKHVLGTRASVGAKLGRVCWCGWKGPWRDTRLEAVADGEAHLAPAVAPPKHAHTWQLTKTGIKTHWLVIAGEYERHPFCTGCGEYGPRFLG